MIDYINLTQLKQFGRVAADSWWILLGETPDLSPKTGATVKECVLK